MNSDSLVSIITPAYNTDQYIKETIQSVQSQTWKNWEMIIVDDNSRDKTCEVIRTESEIDHRIKSFCHETNRGVSEARNTGLKHAQGRYIAFLDSDDLWHRDKLTKQISFMQKTDTALCYTDYDHINPDGKLLKTTNWIKEKFTYHELLNFNGIGSLTVVLDSKKVGAFSVQKQGHEDYILWLDILKRGIVARGIKQVLAHHRILSHSLSRNKWKAACWTWKIYRESQKLALPKALYHFTRYTIHSLIKYTLK